MYHEGVRATDTGHPAQPGVGAARPDADVEAASTLDATAGASLEDVAAAASIEAQATPEREYGVPGPPLDRRSPFAIGFAGAFGVAAAFFLLWALYSARGLLTEIGLGFFIALGLDPVVTWLERRGWPRRLAVLVVALGALAVLGGIIAQVAPVVANQVNNLVNNLPHYQQALTAHNGFIGRLNTRYHIVTSVQRYINSNQSKLAGGVIGVGRAVLNGVLKTLIVIVVSLYVLAELPRLKRTLYALAPRSRRARVVLLGDEMFAKVGGYVIGNVLISLIAGVATWVWALVFGIPFPLLLATLVAIFDLVPLVGSTIGGVIVALVALTVSLPVAIATVAFYLLFRGLEDYLLTPRVMGATIKVPGIVTVVSTLFGGALLGIVGALIAIPVAAAVLLVLREVILPSMNRD